MTDVIAEDYKGYSTFVEVKDVTLRAFNQWNILSNMRENKLFQLMEDYISNLPKTDRVGLLIVSEYISKKGLEETKRELISSGKLNG